MQSVWQTLEWKQNKPNKFILLEDCVSARADFLVVTKLCFLLTENESVLLFAVKETVQHYSSIARKLGINLSTFISSGQLYTLTPDVNNSNILSSLLTAAKTFLGEVSCNVIVDNVSVLFNLTTPRNVIAWLRYLEGISKDHVLVVGISSDIEEDRSLVSLLEHRADSVLHVQVLQSGFSKDISGQLSVTKRDVNGALSGSTLHYRCQETSIQLFLRGSK